jgi:hypothetical protein
VTGLPMTMTGGIRGVEIVGQPVSLHARGGEPPLRDARLFLDDGNSGFRTGRDFAETDAKNTPFVAVVSESFVRRYFPSEDPLGKRISSINRSARSLGVTGEVRVRGSGAEQRTAGLPVVTSRCRIARASATSRRSCGSLLYAGASPTALMPLVRQIIHDTDPLQPISRVRSLREILSEQTASRVVQVRVIGAFAVIAFLLAAVGILWSYSRSPSRSAGTSSVVRMALGAQRARSSAW